MTLEEDLALVRLRDELRAKAPPFRVAMMQPSAQAEAASEQERAARQDERRGRVDKITHSGGDAYWQELRRATEPSATFRPEAETYNVLKDRRRPPPPRGATLSYEY